MRKSRPGLMLLLGAVVLSSGVSAQNQARAVKPALAATKDPFVGVWKLSAERSKYESGGAPKSFTRTYEDRGGGTIFMTTDVSIPQGSTRAYLVYRRDGKPYPEAALGAESIRMVTVTALDSRTESMSVLVDGKAPSTPTTISISPDGLTMTQVVTGTNSKGKAFTNTVGYERQP